ncbi:hypothetical protein RRG08_060680 [Elysia crispata]|uniref:Uncharacterized protein n=1 Tax=Elysia crispata TaxID=231223 RepID=A0AAE0YRT8_9GAST|nr:hypothetical protein RRG08_060680 [Elysia crispata]
MNSLLSLGKQVAPDASLSEEEYRESLSLRGEVNEVLLPARVACLSDQNQYRTAPITGYRSRIVSRITGMSLGQPE